MQKFLLKIVSFIAVAVVFYVPFVLLLGGTPLHGHISYIPANYGHLRSRIRDISSHHDVDLLFLGSSHCYRTFDTRQYASAGYRSFNFGSSNQTPLQTLALLRTYLDSLSPKQVLFEVHPDIMAGSGVESSLDVLSNCPINCAMFRMALEIHTPRTLNTLVYAAFQNRKTVHEDSIIRVKTDVNGEQVMTSFAYVPGGFVELPCYRYKPQLLSPRTISVQPRQLRAFKECLALLRQRNIPYTLIEVPASRNLYHAYTNHKEFAQTMSQLGPYVNLNDSTFLTQQLNDTLHYFDEDHLNGDGVKIVNKYLIECILSD